MSEKPESDEFDEDKTDEDEDGNEESELDEVIKDLDVSRKRDQKAGDPAWRRLERVLEDKRTRELMSDFEDYEIDDA